MYEAVVMERRERSSIKTRQLAKSSLVVADSSRPLNCKQGHTAHPPPGYTPTATGCIGAALSYSWHCIGGQ